jgi:hypothetical protein
VFSCTREVAEAIVADQQRSRDDYRRQLRAQGVTGEEADRQLDQAMASLTFDGDTIVADQRGVYGDPEAIDRIALDHEGRYVVMGRSWCWEAVDPADCDRIVGDLPAPGQQQQFVMLTHTPWMRVPHDRLQATDVRHRPTHDGLAFTATLTLDGRPVATVSNDGGGTELSRPDPRFEAEGLPQYLAGCRFRGEPVSQQRLLDALVDEYYLSRAVAHAQTDDGSQVRLVDDAGYTRALRPVSPAPRGWDALLSLGRDLARETGTTGGVWQIWTGTAWYTLPQLSPEGARPAPVTIRPRTRPH